MKFVNWFRQLSKLRQVGVAVNFALIAYSLAEAARWPWGLALAALGPGYSLWLIAKLQRQEACEREMRRRARDAGVLLEGDQG